VVTDQRLLGRVLERLRALLPGDRAADPDPDPDHGGGVTAPA
jgi:hypothetical protein